MIRKTKSAMIRFFFNTQQIDTVEENDGDGKIKIKVLGVMPSEGGGGGGGRRRLPFKSDGGDLRKF